MKSKILDILSDLESQKNVKVLYAAESGSRAWGSDGSKAEDHIGFFVSSFRIMAMTQDIKIILRMVRTMIPKI